MTVPQDHRVRVAKIRREKMHDRLLEAVMASYAHRRQQIEDVIEEAGVSRATFYKYFASLDEALDVLGEKLKEEVRNDIGQLVDNTHSALDRTTAGIQVFLLRGVTDPNWAGFVSQTNYVARDELLRKMIAADLETGRKEGVLHFEDCDAATTLMLGTLMEAIQFLSSTGERRRNFVEELNIMILCGLGVPHEQAAKTVRERTIYVRGLAPDKLKWWRDPWI